MQISALPIGPVYYQPVAPVPPVAPVKTQPDDIAGADRKPRAAPPPGLGWLFDIEA